MIIGSVSGKIFSFMGFPGSGKSIVARLCSDRIGAATFSTGNFCRKHIKLGTLLGDEIKKSLDAGVLIADNLIVNAVVDWIIGQKAFEESIILDGFPRTTGQAKLFLNYLDKLGLRDNFVVVNFVIDGAIVADWLSDRFVCENLDCQMVYSSSFDFGEKSICSKCGSKLVKRSDDNLEEISKRLRRYPFYRDSLLDFYSSDGVVVKNLEADEFCVEKTFDSFKSKIVRLS